MAAEYHDAITAWYDVIILCYLPYRINLCMNCILTNDYSTDQRLRGVWTQVKCHSGVWSILVLLLCPNLDPKKSLIINTWHYFTVNNLVHKFTFIQQTYLQLTIGHKPFCQNTHWIIWLTISAIEARPHEQYLYSSDIKQKTEWTTTEY